MSVFEFTWKNRPYFVEGTRHSLEHIVLSDTREVLTISEWTDETTPKIGALIRVHHDYQESLAEELSQIFNAPIATIAEPKKLEKLEEE
jgi:hypothetical protein